MFLNDENYKKRSHQIATPIFVIEKKILISPEKQPVCNPHREYFEFQYWYRDSNIF
jgi:hypothetical protein